MILWNKKLRLFQSPLSSSCMISSMTSRLAIAWLEDKGLMRENSRQRNLAVAEIPSSKAYVLVITESSGQSTIEDFVFPLQSFHALNRFKSVFNGVSLKQTMHRYYLEIRPCIRCHNCRKQRSTVTFLLWDRSMWYPCISMELLP